MQNFFGYLFLLTLLALIVGLFKPSLVIRWGEIKTRRRVLLIYGVSMFVFMMLTGATAPELTPEQKQAKEIAKQQEAATVAAKQTSQESAKREKQNQEDAIKKEKQAYIAKKVEIANQVDVKVIPDFLTMDSKDNTKIGVIVKNNSDYRILKGSITIKLKDAAGNTVDSDTLDFTKPVDAHMGSGGILWLKAKRITGSEYTVNVSEFE